MVLSSATGLKWVPNVAEEHVVVEIDATEQQALLDIAVSELGLADLDLAHTKRALNRAQTNRRQNALSESRFDEFQTAFDKSRVNRQLMSGRVKLQQTRLEKHKIRAPFSVAISYQQLQS